jgi:hypothetical protein
MEMENSRNNQINDAIEDAKTNPPLSPQMAKTTKSRLPIQDFQDHSSNLRSPPCPRLAKPRHRQCQRYYLKFLTTVLYNLQTSTGDKNYFNHHSSNLHR